MARRILLADDSVTAQNMGRKILTDAGYEVVAVNNGSAALKKIAEHKPDIIVLDVYMPGYSGLEVCQRIKENRETSRIPVLLTVGKLEPFKPEEARKARADAFVVKPFEASELLTALTKLEDKIIPTAEPYKQGRFAKAAAAIEDEGAEPAEKFGDKDQGWRARLRFPSRKQKQPEAEEAPDNATVGGKDFRDLPKMESTRAAEPPVPSKPASASSGSQEFERPLPSGLPHDITPEEIAAITAAATKLSGAGPEVAAAIESAKLVETAASGVEAVAHAPEAVVAPTAAVDESLEVSKPVEKGIQSATNEVVASVAEPAIAKEPVTAVEPTVSRAAGSEEMAPVTFASAPGLEIEGESDVPVAPIAATEFSKTAPATGEGLKVEAIPAEILEIEEPQTKVEEAEPAKAVVLPAAEVHPVIDAVAEPQASKIVEEGMEGSAAEPTTPIPSVAPMAEDSASVSSFGTSVELEAPKPVEAAQVAGHAAVEHRAPAVPADDDVMAALQSLIPPPSPEAATVRALPGQQASSANEMDLSYVGSQGSSPRWMAEEIALSPEEGGASLEREMEAAYAAFAASEAARLLASSVLETFPGTQAAMPAAADIDAAAASEVRSPEATIPVPTEPAAVAAPAPVEPVPAYAMAAGAGERGASGGSVASMPPSPADEISEVTAGVHEEASPAAVSMPAAGVHETEIVPAEPVAAPAIAEESSLAEGTDDMDRKHSESLGFKMIRQSPAASKAVAKAEPVSKETFEPPAPSAEPAAMAAAAAAESAPAAPAGLSVADPKAIASIVDSVLAELRPKIVEEIAKKLAGDGKKE